MDKNAKIYVAGHCGLVGSAIVRNLLRRGYKNILMRKHAELDLTDAIATRNFFASENPDYVFLAAAKVGGIHANNTYPADFIRDNLAIQINVIHAAYLSEVKRLLFLGSSCIYPKSASQPIKEEYLLTGPLEPTNRPYALAKIAGVEMCWSYNRQYGTRYLSVMPTNLFGWGDNFHPENSHVIPALIRRFHEAKVQCLEDVVVWGSGAPRREFLYSDDMADACIFLLALPEPEYELLLGEDEVRSGKFVPPIVNIGAGVDLTISELAGLVRDVVGFPGRLSWDLSKLDGVERKLLDSSRLQSLGWKPRIGLRAGLEKAYNCYLSERR